MIIDTCQFQKEITKNGYVRIKTENGWELEHVYVVSQFIGRELNPGETIHHLDHVRTNNVLSNLFLFKNQADHKKFENDELRFGRTRLHCRMIANRWKEFK